MHMRRSLIEGLEPLRGGAVLSPLLQKWLSFYEREWVSYCRNKVAVLRVGCTVGED